MQAIVTGTEDRLGYLLAGGLAAAGFRVRRLPMMTADRAHTSRLMSDACGLAGRLDLLVLSGWAAVATTPAPLEDLDDDSFAAIWEDGVQGMLWAIQAAIPALRAARGAVVVLLPTTGMTGGAHYAAAAAALEGQRVLVKSAARQLAPEGISVNAIAIGPELILSDADAADVHYLAPPAPGGYGDLPETAATVVDAIGTITRAGARRLTGQTLTIDGGRWLAP